MTQPFSEESLYPKVQGFPALFEPVFELEGNTTDLGDQGVRNSVAQVIIDTTVPYLERPFEYRVLPDQDADAVVGARVLVSFHNQELTGFIRARVARADFGGELKALKAVISPIPVVSDQVFELAEAVADRYSGIVPDVLRKAIPPRALKVEKKFLPFSSQQSNWAETLPEDLSAEGFNLYENGPEFITDLKEGSAARAVMTVLPGAETTSWSDLLASALITVAATGRGALAVVPDIKALNLLEESLRQLTDARNWARLTAHDSNSARYQAFLRVRSGQVGIVIGTRSAAYAPVHNLGFVACWDDGDTSLVEHKAPYAQARDILLLRAQKEKAAALFLAYGMSSESARLIGTRWATHITANRETIREYTPRVTSTGDEYQLARDPLAAFARIPHLAFEVAKKALETGPVLVQVARSGYVPHLSCQRCRLSARCAHCGGPLQVQSATHIPHCTWCGQLAVGWRCFECQNNSWRMTTKGALRTAEELGRAFPDIPVISSSGEHVKERIGAKPVLVVATPGAEPVAESGYAAALLLDADSMLQRDSLRAPEQALRHWFNAASLVRPFSAGGRVITTASQSPAVDALVRWDAWGFANFELGERTQLLLPPASRTAALTGRLQAVETFLSLLDLPESVKVAGPNPLEDSRGFWDEEEETELYRAILFFTYAQAPEVTHLLRATRASLAAARTTSPVQVRCDGLDIL